MQKVVCNTRVMNANLTGVQRYTQCMLKYFPEDEVELIGPPTNISRGVKGHLWDQFVLPRKVGKNLLWSPNNTGPIYFKRQVLTLHDVVAIDHPEWLNKTFAKWYQFLTPRLCKSAAHIITISEYSKQRILELFDLPESKVTVVYNGVDAAVADDTDGDRYELPFKRYILSLGSIEPRKNIPMLLQAWAKVQQQLPDDIGLIIVGAKGSGQVFKETFITEVPDKVHFTGHIPDSHIKQLYSEALFFVYLSLYEGFGLPPLEAMSRKTAVLTGDKTSLPEVVGDGGMMIDPYSLAECEAALLKLATNDSLRNELALKGYEQSKRFSWETAAAETWDIINAYRD